jgi:hypothetical protein
VVGAALALVEREAGDVDEPDGIGDRGGRDDRAAVRVPDEQDGAGVLLRDVGRVGGVGVEVAQRRGDGDRVDPARDELVDHARPDRPVGERSVDEDDERSEGERHAIDATPGVGASRTSGDAR